MLKLNNIEVTYLNVIRVLHGVSLTVEEGSIVALLGANGAGKSTTLKAISGLLHTEEGEVTDGSIQWDEQRIDKSNAEAIPRMSSGYASAATTLHPMSRIVRWCSTSSAKAGPSRPVRTAASTKPRIYGGSNSPRWLEMVSMV